MSKPRPTSAKYLEILTPTTSFEVFPKTIIETNALDERKYIWSEGTWYECLTTNMIGLLLKFRFNMAAVCYEIVAAIV